SIAGHAKPPSGDADAGSGIAVPVNWYAKCKQSLYQNWHAWTHCGANGYRFYVMALHACRLDGADLVEEGVDVVGELVLVEAQLADAGVNIAALVGAELDLAGFELLDRLGDVGGD